MKSLLGLIVVGSLCLSLAACGDSKGAGPTSQAAAGVKTSTTPPDTAPAPLETKADADKDNDLGTAQDDPNNNSVLDFGHAANASNTRLITTLIKRYYAAAYAEDGAKACSMIYSLTAESVPEDFGQSPPGPQYMQGKTCSAVLTLLFKHFHPQIALELPKLKVARVRLLEHHGMAVLSFGAMPELAIYIVREGHTWRLVDLLGHDLS